MPHWLDKLLNRKPSPEPVAITREEADLEAFFTDFEHLRDVFSQLVTAPTLPKRLLVIHGVGGAGKSTLLRMFRLYCKRQHVPVALASGDEAKTPVDILDRFVKDLGQANLRLPDLERTLEQYRAIQAKVKRESTKLDRVARTGAKVAVEVAAGYVPVVGPVVAALGGAGSEALVDWLRDFLAKSELDLYLDPTDRLIQDFVGDIAPIAERHRVVLMLDTYEQMTGLDGWVRDLAQRLPANVLTVIAGRATPGEAWYRDWPGWRTHTRIEPLEAMDDDTMRTLVRRYYATMRDGEPDPDQVEEIVEFARGLPLVITSAVRLWIDYDMKGFHAIKPQVVADLVDRLMAGTPEEMRPALEAAAVVRWFNREVLRALLSATSVEAIFDDLRRFPFVHPRAGGFALHDVVREMLDENLQLQDPERHLELHTKAMLYYERKADAAAGDEQERLVLERLYHCFFVDEDRGTQLFCQMCEELALGHLAYRLQVMLNEAQEYPIERVENQLWRDYYRARMVHLEQRSMEAASRYQSLYDNPQASPKLKAYALCDAGKIFSRWVRLSEPNGIQRAESVLKRSLSLWKLDNHTVRCYLGLAFSSNYQAKWDESLSYLERAKAFYEDSHNKYGLGSIYCNIMDVYGFQGMWKEYFETRQRGLDIVSATATEPYWKAQLIGGWAIAQIWAGRYSDAERNVNDAIAVTERVGDVFGLVGFYTDRVRALGAQARFSEAEEAFHEAKTFLEGLDEAWQLRYACLLGYWGAILIRQGRHEEAKEYLESSLEIKNRHQDEVGIQEVLIWLGRLHELKAQAPQARSFYERGLELTHLGRNYFSSAAYVGLCRLMRRQSDVDFSLSYSDKANQLARQHEYNDHLACLRLTQGHIAWDGHLTAWGTGFDAALAQYQQALIYALRYNRFLLDEVLWGGDICTPLDPIIPHCLERSNEGRQMLAALSDWWETGRNDVGQPRPDTISPIPEGISLLEAEQLARRREPGDGSPQQTVAERIGNALTME